MPAALGEQLVEAEVVAHFAAPVRVRAACSVASAAGERGA